MWIKSIIVLLLAVNYMLLHNKLYFIVDCAFVVVLGIFSLLDSGERHSYYVAKPMLDTFYLLLIFTSMRVLNRLELRHLFSRAVALKAKMLVLTSFFMAAMLWYASCALPAPLMLSGLTTIKSNLKNMGTALEMYSADHKGLYPEKLEQLTPGYLKTLPPIAYNVKAGTEKYYQDKYGQSLSYAYEVDNTTFNYTVEVGFPGYYSSSHKSVLRYTSREGLAE
ncbi:MAG: hypothetical protein AB2L14_11280 [Candidatus Xenobiia bacterium LiM19]